MDLKECVICGERFELKSKYPRKTCSKKCRYKSHQITSSRNRPKVKRRCVTCGKIFFKPPSIVYDKRQGRNNNSIYCSRKCRWSKNSAYTKKQKSHARNAISTAILYNGLKRKPCCICDEVKSEAHHYRGYDKENWFDVIWYCRTHHQQEHERLKRLGIVL